MFKRYLKGSCVQQNIWGGKILVQWGKETVGKVRWKAIFFSVISNQERLFIPFQKAENTAQAVVEGDLAVE